MRLGQIDKMKSSDFIECVGDFYIVSPLPIMVDFEKENIYVLKFHDQ